MVKNVVLIRMIGTMTEFKQIIGRGTRLREDYGKYYFNILDYTGTATRHLADPEFDGDPEFVSEEEIDEKGNTTTTTVIGPDGPTDPEEGSPEPSPNDEVILRDGPPPVITDPPEPPPQPAKYYVEKGKVRIAAHLTQDLDSEGRQLRVTEFRDYTGEVVKSFFSDPEALRRDWRNPDRRAETLALLKDKGIDVAEAANLFGQPEADPFDLLCNLAWNAPVLTRKERASRLREDKPDFFARYAVPARDVLDALLTKYAEHGPAEFTIPDSLKVPPLSEFGNVTEITERFGGPDQFRSAIVELQLLLYAA